MAQNLSKAMPCTASFQYGTSGKTDASATNIIKGQGDLRAKKGTNAGANMVGKSGKQKKKMED